MGIYKCLVGQKYGELTVLSRTEDYISPNGYVDVNYLCECACGKTLVIRASNLRSGKSRSCGCNRKTNPNRTTHGLSKTRIYTIWKSIKQRYEDKSSKNYSDYGGRGIIMCAEWSKNFMSFYDWSQKNGYDKSLSIDRIDNDLGYSPENCRWTNNFVQANNTRHNRMIVYEGQSHTMSEWSKITGIKYQKIKDRLNKCGWSIEKTLTTQ